MRRGRPERFIVQIDDEQELIFAPETVLKYGLAPEKKYSDQEFLRILQEDNLQRAKDQAMRYLSIRPHSRRELVQKMFRKGYRSEIIHQALDRLQEIDLVNDRQFAKLFIQNELRLRPVGRALLKKKLIEKGIPREMYESILSEMYTEEAELEIAGNLAAKFLRMNSRFEGKKLREKMVRFLQGKGFGWEHIQQVLREENNV